jgi:hypothetical protein
MKIQESHSFYDSYSGACHRSSKSVFFLTLAGIDALPRITKKVDICGMEVYFSLGF